MTRRLVAVLFLALALTGCVSSILDDPTDPAWDSVQIADAYQVQSDVSLLVLLATPALILGAVGVMLGALGRRR